MHRAVSPVFVESKKVSYRDARASKGSVKQEIQANGFAAELLMPEEEVRKPFAAKVSLMDIDSIEGSDTIRGELSFFCRLSCISWAVQVK